LPENYNPLGRETGTLGCDPELFIAGMSLTGANPYYYYHLLDDPVLSDPPSWDLIKNKQMDIIKIIIDILLLTPFIYYFNNMNMYYLF